MRTINIYIYTDRGFVLVQSNEADKKLSKRYEQEKKNRSLTTLPLFAWTYLHHGRIVECFGISTNTYFKKSLKYKAFREKVRVNFYLVLFDWTFFPYAGMRHKYNQPRLLRRSLGTIHSALRYMHKRDSLFFYPKGKSSYEQFQMYFKQKRLYHVPLTKIRDNGF